MGAGLHAGMNARLSARLGARLIAVLYAATSIGMRARLLDKLKARLVAELGAGLNEWANGGFLYDWHFNGRDRGSGNHASQRVATESRRFRCIFVSSVIIRMTVMGGGV